MGARLLLAELLAMEGLRVRARACGLCLDPELESSRESGVDGRLGLPSAFPEALQPEGPAPPYESVSELLPSTTVEQLDEAFPLQGFLAAPTSRVGQDEVWAVSLERLGESRPRPSFSPSPRGVNSSSCLGGVVESQGGERVSLLVLLELQLCSVGLWVTCLASSRLPDRKSTRLNSSH